MTVKYHKKNTNFQIENFLIKGAHTPDNAYFQLLELKEERMMALDAYNVGVLKTEAKKKRINFLMKQADEISKIELEAEYKEISNWEKYEKEMYLALMDELAFIERKLHEIKPLCKYVDKMDLITAHEEAQREAWLIELQQRAENYLITTGTIPADELKTMKNHPDFNTSILPKIADVKHKLETEKNPIKLLEVNLK